MIESSQTWSSRLLFLIIAANLKVVNLEKTETVCNTTFCQQAAENLKESINPAVDPCENFYEFACGKWPKKHPPKTLFLSSSTLTNRNDENTKHLKEYLSKNNSNEEPIAVRKARKLYSLCNDTAKLDTVGLTPLLHVFKKVGLNLNSTDEFDLIYTIAKSLRILGKELFFSFGVAPNPYNRRFNRISILQPSGDSGMIPSLVSKLNDNTYESLSLRDYISMALNATCENIQSVKCDRLRSSQANDLVVDYSSAISEFTAKAYPEDENKPQLITLAELQNITDAIALKNNVSSTFNWTRLTELIFENTTVLNWTTFDPKNLTIVAEITYLKDILPLILKLTSVQLEVGITWKMVDELAYYSASQIRELKQRYSWELQYNTRQEWCALTVAKLMGEAVSYFYTTLEWAEFIKSEVISMEEYVIEEFRGVLQSIPWMDDLTKSKAVNKTRAMKRFISFPEWMGDKEKLDNYYSSIEIKDHFLETAINNTEKAVISRLYTLNSTNNITKDRGNLTPVMVNAFYDSEQNAIVIPAGILGFPLCANGIQALNYGSIGTVLGHEITHGFDTKGRLYNYVGNLEDWWNDQSLAAFRNKTKCFKEKYSTYYYEQAGINVTADGELTLPENIADNGGFKSALLGYRKYLSEHTEPLLPHFENYTHEQLFTLGFAQVWCEHPTLITAFLSSSQIHSPNIIRVNGVLMNSKEFPKIWNCPANSTMNPQEKCELW